MQFFVYLYRNSSYYRLLHEKQKIQHKNLMRNTDATNKLRVNPGDRDW
jgi:hypothetical protein